tara:strand:+ start:250 stop:513 length:264 start_codon:yes stop_codon:yes gene_type:complete
MDSNDLIIIIIALISLFLIRNYVNKYVVVLIIATSLVGICVTKKIVVSIAIALIMGSVYTMLFNKNPMSYEEFKIRKETLVAEESKN